MERIDTAETTAAAPVPAEPLTLDEYLALGEDVKAQIIDGKLVLMSPTGPQHGEIAGNVFGFIWSFVRQHRLGLTYTEQTAYVEEGAQGLKGALVPDVSFVRRERIPPDHDPTKPFTFAPDLAVEVLSPSDTYQATAEKIGAYLARGVPLLWIVNPFDRTVTVYTQVDQAGVILAAGDSLDGGSVLPGFTLPVADIFADILEEEQSG